MVSARTCPRAFVVLISGALTTVLACFESTPSSAPAGDAGTSDASTGDADRATETGAGDAGTSAEDAGGDAAPLGNITAISVGTDTVSCARANTGAVFCWGGNDFATLGDGTDTPHTAPVLASALTVGATAIGVGAFHACAIVGGGHLSCWGSNVSGEIGDGTVSTSVPLPDMVTGITDAIAVTSGYQYTCALSSAGKVKCWGANGLGTLGIGPGVHAITNPAPLDVDLPADDVVLDVVAGAVNACSLHASGKVRCWGSAYGDTPAEIATPTGVTALAVGDGVVCMVTKAGGVSCVGKNTSGQLGSGAPTASSVPVAVPGITTGATAVAAGGSHMCAIVASTVRCWGGNQSNQALAGSTTIAPPVTIAGLPPAVAIASGGSRTCALGVAGEVFCWGANDAYQLGDGTNATRTTPVKVIGLP